MLTPEFPIAAELSVEKNIAEQTLFRVSHWQFKIFSCFWAIATLFHMAHSGLFDNKLIYALLSLAAIFVISRPGNLIGFILLIFLQLYDIIFLMPGVTNHWLFTGFANLSILQALFYLIYKHKSFRVDKGEWFKLFAPVIRIEVVILYFFAVFQKLNSSFFSPDVSCAIDLLKAQLPSFISIPPEIFVFNAYFTILIEIAIPVLLLLKRTRRWGILFGLIFHSILSYSTYNAYYDFSSMIFAAYFLFASPDFSSFLARQWTKNKLIVSSTLFNSNFSFFKLFIFLGGLLAGLAIIHVLNKRLFTSHVFHLHFFWTGYSIIYIGFFLGFLLGRPSSGSRETRASFSLPQWSFFIFPLLVIFNGLSPFLGLKTENSFSMFSNLRTEGGISNHFIIPASFQIFDYQKDLVEIVSSSDTVLQEFANTHQLMVYFSFKEHMARMRPQRVEYIRNGERKSFALNNPATHETLLVKNSLLLRKLFWFKPVSKFNPQPCSH